MRRFDSLKVWQRSHALVLEVYEVTRRFPNDERFGLSSQLRRAAVSVPANIAEGCKRASDVDFARHVAIAEGSASEVEYLLLLAAELGYLDIERSHRLRKELEEVSRMLDALRLTLRDEGPPRPFVIR